MRKAYLAMILCLTAPGVLAPARGQQKQAPAAEKESAAGQEQENRSGNQNAEGNDAKDKLEAKAGAPVDPKAYVIGPEDVLQIRVWREPELSGMFAVRPDGKISMPLIGELVVGGRTPDKVEAEVGERLTKFMNRPVVTLVVQQVNSKKYFIQGEVLRPGSFPLVVPTTVLEALSNCGGFRDFANTKKIIILRGSQRFKFNYKDVTRGKHMEQNILLEPGDQIIVP